MELQRIHCKLIRHSQLFKFFERLFNPRIHLVTTLNNEEVCNKLLAPVFTALRSILVQYDTVSISHTVVRGQTASSVSLNHSRRCQYGG